MALANPESGNQPPESDYPTAEELAESRERVASRVRYTPEMLQQDGGYAVQFVHALIRSDPDLTATKIARILHDHITPLKSVMDTIDDDSLTPGERMTVHLSRLTSARGQSDQARFADRRQRDRQLAQIEAHRATSRSAGHDRIVAISRLVDLRASINWGDREEVNQWFLHAYHRLAYEPDKTSTT